MNIYIYIRLEFNTAHHLTATNLIPIISHLDYETAT